MSKFTFNKTTGKLEAVEEVDVNLKEEIGEELPTAEDPGENEAEIVFKKFSDLSIMRVDDENTGKWLCYFAGYALDIQFNVEELKGAHAMQKIEAALGGLNRLFRKIILDQVLG